MEKRVDEDRIGGGYWAGVAAHQKDRLDVWTPYRSITVCTPDIVSGTLEGIWYADFFLVFSSCLQGPDDLIFMGVFWVETFVSQLASKVRRNCQ
jgi:hypothetical protein